MAIGIFGTNTTAILDIQNDLDIFYSYTPTRNTIDSNFGDGFIKVSNPLEMLSPSIITDDSNLTNGVNNILGGVYNLNLPLTIFSNKGIYTIYITPREIYGQITDVPATLTAISGIRGIVLKSSDFSGINIENGGLVGWKVNYFDVSGNRLDDFKIIVSNNFVEPIAENLSNTSQKSISYRYNDNSDLIFLTVSPSSAPSVKPNVLPSIGAVGQTISLNNTKFNPVLLEIEMVDSDFTTITDLLSGNQALNLDSGTLTTYNSNRDIINQVEVMTKKDAYSGKALYELRKNMENMINRNENWENTFSGV